MQKSHRDSLCACSVLSNPLQPHGLSPARLLCPWGFSSKTPGVGCYFFLQGSQLGSHLHLLHLFQWQADSLPLHHLGILHTKSGQFAKRKKKKNRAGENLNLGVGCLQLWLLQARLTTAIKADHRERALGKAYCVCPGVREQWAWRRLLNHMLLKCLYLLWHTMQQSKGGHGIRHGIKTDWNEVLEKQRVEGHINSVP